MAEKSEKPKSFWATLPGILTGLAALIAALVGLFVALGDAGYVGKDIASRAPSGPAVAPGSMDTYGDNSPNYSGNSGIINFGDK